MLYKCSNHFIVIFILNPKLLLFFFNLMSETQAIIDGIIGEASKNAGTWSTDYTRSLGVALNNMKPKTRNQFVHDLLEKVADGTYNNGIKFKVAQLLSCLKSFFCPAIQSSLFNEKETILLCVENISEDGQISAPTKQMFSNLLEVPNTIGAKAPRSFTPPKHEVHSRMAIPPAVAPRFASPFLTPV